MSGRRTTLGAVTHWLSGGTPSRSVADFWNGTIPWISASTLRLSEVSDSDQKVTPEAVAAGSKMAPVNSTLLLVRGSALYNEIRAGLVVSPVCFNQDVKALVPAPGLVPKYLTYSLLGRARDLLSLVSTAGNTAGVLDTKLVQAFEILLPPEPEQHAIAEALSDVDELIGALEKLIAKKRAIKQATMQQLLTGNTRLPGFTGEWEALKVLDVISRYFCGPSPTCEERNIEGEEWGVLKTTAATKESGWSWRKHKVLPSAYWGRTDLELRVGDVIITKAGPRHRVAVAAAIDYVPDRIIVSGKMIGLRPNTERVVPLLLASALHAKETQVFLDQRTTGMAESQVNFENSALLAAPITLPKIEEQHAIAAVLSDMDAEIAALERRRDKTTQIKQGMMQELLTGRIRLVEQKEATQIC